MPDGAVGEVEGYDDWDVLVSREGDWGEGEGPLGGGERHTDIVWGKFAYGAGENWDLAVAWCVVGIAVADVVVGVEVCEGEEVVEGCSCRME